MKALLIAAAILAPALALANDPAMKDPSAKNTKKTHATDLTSTQVLGKLRMINTTSIEMGDLAQANSESARVKALGASMAKSFQALDKTVTDYALKNNIVLSSGTLVPSSTTYDRDPAAVTTRRDETAGTVADRTAMNDGARGTSGHNDSMPSGGTAITGSTAYPDQGDVDQLAKREEKMSELRSLRGADFDREFLSRVVEKGNKWIGMLQETKGKFDKTVDGQVTKTIDTLKKNVSEAQRLSTTQRST